MSLNSCLSNERAAHGQPFLDSMNLVKRYALISFTFVS